MTIIYCAQDKRAAVKEALDLEYNHVFASPSDQAVDHSATRVIIVGNHPSIEERYKGIARVEYFDQSLIDPEADNTFEDLPPDAEFPYHYGGGNYFLSNGEKVNGREEAEAAQSELDSEDTDE